MKKFQVFAVVLIVGLAAFALAAAEIIATTGMSEGGGLG
jgi:hypothetical protein